MFTLARSGGQDTQFSGTRLLRAYCLSFDIIDWIILCGKEHARMNDNVARLLVTTGRGCVSELQKNLCVCMCEISVSLTARTQSLF